MSLKVNLRILKVLSDETRLQLLFILKQSEFTVSELVLIQEMHQSNISRHLSQLREAGLLVDRKEGTLVYYRWSETLRSSTELKSLLKSTWTEIADSEGLKRKIQEVLDLRRKRTQSFFEGVAGHYNQLATPGGGAEGLVAALASLVHARYAVDVGCGEGDFSLLLARGCKKVLAVDLSEKMLQVVRSRAQQSGLHHIETQKGDLETLPLEDEEVDLVVMSQVLHHAPSPLLAIEEMARILEPQGQFIILDLYKHNNEWLKENLGDLWLGFEEVQLKEWLTLANLKIDVLTLIPTQGEIPLVLVKGHKA